MFYVKPERSFCAAALTCADSFECHLAEGDQSVLLAPENSMVRPVPRM